jgi:membrane-associated PAP2 superfamily phosphatase
MRNMECLRSVTGKFFLSALLSTVVTISFAASQQDDAGVVTTNVTKHSNLSTFMQKSWLSTKNFYKPRNLLKLSGGIAVNALLANTTADQSFANWYQDHVRSSFTNKVASYAKPFGTISIVAWGYAGAIGLSYFTYDSKFGGVLGRWTSNSLQSIIVGAPTLLILQRAIGSARPEAENSKWDCFHGSHGASGHAFLGAIPFLTAAKMSNRWFTKTLFYTASTLPGLSRINDNDHYLSQVILGWWIADLSEDSVFHVERAAVQLSPMYVRNGVGASATVSID